MEPGEETTCRTCRFWEFWNEKATDKEGECHRHSPEPIAVPISEKVSLSYYIENNAVCLWPQTRNTDFCGDWDSDK